MPLFFHSSAHPSTNAAHPAFERVLKGERATRDATLALLERYGGPAGMKRAGIEDVKDWARSNGLRAGRIIDDMFKAIGCFASMFVRQVRQCFSAVWADGFPRCRHRFPVM